MAKATTKDGIWGTMILSKQGIEAATRLNAFYQQNGSDIIDAASTAVAIQTRSLKYISVIVIGSCCCTEASWDAGQADL
jgi:hypothetical protein